MASKDIEEYSSDELVAASKYTAALWDEYGEAAAKIWVKGNLPNETWEPVISLATKYVFEEKEH